MKNCAVSPYRMVFSVIAAYAFIFCFDLVLHVGLLMPCYLATKDVWNTPEHMGGRQIWYPVFQLMSALTISVFYICWRHRNAGNVTAASSRRARYSDGLGFGGFAGLLSGISMAGFYVYLPIPGTLAAAWAVGEVVKGMGLGLVLTAVYPTPSTSHA